MSGRDKRHSSAPEHKDWLCGSVQSLSPPSAKVKNEWSYTSTPPYAVKMCKGIKL